MPETSTSAEISPVAATNRLIRWPRSASRRILFIAIYCLFLLSVCWAGSWLYLSWTLGKPLTSSVNVWDYFYPEMQTSGVMSAEIRKDDQYLDVLLLGGSTIEINWGDVETPLKASLEKAFGDRVRIFNLARIAHTSRDSALKFSRLADKPFDLILIYDGFNDCRMNNVLRRAFQDDYQHCYWYRSFMSRKAAGNVILPHHALSRLADTIELGTPEPNLVQEGYDLKTPGPFRKNLEAIIQGSQRHGTVVLLQTFAFHIPDDYSAEKFRRQELDYEFREPRQRCPLEMWGAPDAVRKCVTVHNTVISELAQEYPRDAIFVDQNALIPHDGQHFVDACHFTPAGCQKFVDNLVPAVIKRLQQRFPLVRQ